MSSNINTPQIIVSLDVGEKRIGIAHADTQVKFPIAYGVVEVDGYELDRLREIIAEFDPNLLVLGYPRNQNGEATAQTRYVEEFSHRLEPLKIPIEFQDESLTSVLAEQYLKNQKKHYTKADIDAHAAAIILGDFLEDHYGK